MITKGNPGRAVAGGGDTVAALVADPRVISVKARKEPLDVSPQSTLTGEVTPDLIADKAGFTLNVVLRVNGRVSHEPA